MDSRNLIHPMTAGDLVQSVGVLAIRERGAETEASIWECVDVEHIGRGWPDIDQSIPHPDARLVVTFRDRQTGETIHMQMKAKTPLLFTRIAA